MFNNLFTLFFTGLLASWKKSFGLFSLLLFLFYFFLLDTSVLHQMNHSTGISTIELGYLVPIWMCDKSAYGRLYLRVMVLFIGAICLKLAPV